MNFRLAELRLSGHIGSPQEAVDVCWSCYFFFSSRRRHTRFDCDWSSDVCSSDLAIWALRRGVWELPLFAGGAVASSLVLYGYSSPWIAGKAFATAAPAVPLAALADRKSVV